MKQRTFSPDVIKPYVGFGTAVYHDISLEPGCAVPRIHVHINGSVNVTGGASNGAATGRDIPSAFVNFVKLEATPGGVIFQRTPRSINRRRIFDRGFFQGDQGTALTGAAGAFTIDTVLTLEFTVPKSRFGAMQTALRLDSFRSLRITIQNGLLADMFPGNDRAWDVSQLNYDIYVEREYVDGNAKAKTSGKKQMPAGLMYQWDQVFQINAANKTFTIDKEIDKSSPYLDALVMTQSTANKTLVDTIINEWRVKSGTDEIAWQKARAIKQFQLKHVNANANQVGLYLFDFTRGGGLLGAVPDPKFVIDLANPGGAGLDELLIDFRRIVFAS